MLLSTLAAFLRVNTGESPSARCDPGSLRPSPPGETVITLLCPMVSFVCFDKIINLQNGTMKAWGKLEINKGGIRRS